MPSKIPTYLYPILSWGLLLFAIGWTLWYVFAGLGNPLDPNYWLYKYSSLEAGWMSAGTILVGGIWVRIFGTELLSLRILGWLSVAVAILLPYMCLLSKEQRRGNIHWLAAAFALMNYGAFQEFSPGTLTVLCLSSCWVALIRYRRNPSLKRAVGIGVLAAITIFVRFPNVLILPVILLGLMLPKEGWKPNRVHITHSLVMAGIGCVFAAILYVIGHNVLIPTYADPAMSSHGLGDMINLLWEKGAMLCGMALLCGGLFAIGALAIMWIPSRWNSLWIIAAGVVAGGLVGYYITFVPIVRQWYNFDVTYLISAFCILFALVSRKPIALWGVALLGVASLGTDTAWLKLFPAVLCLLPVAAAQYSVEWRRYLWPLTIGLAITVMIRFSVNSIAGSNLRYVDTQATVSPYKGIKICENENAWMEQVKADYDSICGQGTVLAVGWEIHRIRAITGCQAARYNEFWSNIFDKVYASKYKEIIRRERPIVICSFSPHFKTKPEYKDCHSAFEEMLREEGYREIDRSQYKYMIYIPEP